MDILGISLRTLNRLKKKGGRFSRSASKRLLRCAGVLALAVEVMGDTDPVITWFHNKQVGLVGKKPIDLIKTEAGAIEVSDLLGRIKHSVYS